MGTKPRMTGKVGPASRRVAEILDNQRQAMSLSLRDVEARTSISYSTLQRLFAGEREVLLNELSELSRTLGLVDWHVMYEAETGQPYSSGVEYILAADGNTESDAEVEAWEQQP